MKIIIHNNTDASELDCLEMVKEVVRLGKQSKGRYGEQFTFGCINKYGYAIYADKTQTGTHTFNIAEDAEANNREKKDD